MVDTSALDTVIARLRTVAVGQYVLPQDHNDVCAAIQAIDAILASLSGGGGGGGGLDIIYPFGGNIALSADPDSDYDTAVSNATGTYVEVDHYDYTLGVVGSLAIFLNLCWAQMVASGDDSYVKWQMSLGNHLSPVGWQDITAETVDSNTNFSDHEISGLVASLGGSPINQAFTIRCLVKHGTSGTAYAKIKSCTYIHVTSR